MLNLCLTADHELFFRENYKTEKEVFIDATYKLMDITKENGASLTLMTDVCSIWRYKELEINEYPNLMEEQLKYAVQNGHDVQLHLHPHWMFSDFENGKWNFEGKKFRLHDIGFDDEVTSGLSANSLIRDGKRYLDELLGSSKPDYKCIAFRAGGWCLQPEEKLLKALLDEGIYIDTTVFEGGLIKAPTHFVDFKGVPKEINWWIDPAKGINFTSNYKKGKSIFEVTIGSFNKKPQLWALKVKNKFKYNNQESQRGIGMLAYPEKMKLIKKFKSRIRNFVNEPILLSFDGCTSETLVKIIEYYLKRFDCVKNNYYISLICHPKFIGTYHLEEIDKFLKTINKEYREVEFSTLQKVYKEVFDNI